MHKITARKQSPDGRTDGHSNAIYLEGITSALFQVAGYKKMTYKMKVKVGNDQEMVQSEKKSHSKIRGGKKLN